MQLEYRLSVKDYQEASQANLKSQRWIYFFFWFFIILWLLTIILDFLLTEFLAKGDIDIYKHIFYVVLTILINPYFNPLVNYLVARAWKDLPSGHQPMSVEVNEEVLKIKSINFDSSMQWQLYIKAVETKKTVYTLSRKGSF